MRRLRLIKVVVPEIVAYFEATPEATRPDYRCTGCGCGVDKAYVCCPYCGSELEEALSEIFKGVKETVVVWRTGWTKISQENLCMTLQICWNAAKKIIPIMLI